METVHINFTKKIKPVKPVNNEFTLCECYVQGVGKNRNMTFMSKRNIKKYIKTLSYCPVVGHIIEVTNIDGEVRHYMGSHDYTIDNDTWEMKTVTVPFGVVVDDTYEFEKVMEYGQEVEYLKAQVILWTGRYPMLNECIYSDDVWFNQSMEINVNEWRPLEKDSNYTELIDWSYSALCLLGKADKNSTNGHTDSSENTEPCFINSKIKPIKFSNNNYENDLQELKDKLRFFLNQTDEKGGDNMIKDYEDEAVNVEDSDDIEDEEHENCINGSNDIKEDSSKDGKNENEDNNGDVSEKESEDDRVDESNSLNETNESDITTNQENSSVTESNTDVDNNVPSNDTVSSIDNTITSDDLNDNDSNVDVLSDTNELIADSNDISDSFSIKDNKVSFEMFENLKKEFDAYKLTYLYTYEDVLKLNELMNESAYNAIKDSDEFKAIVENKMRYSVNEIQTQLDLLLAKNIKEDKSKTNINSVYSAVLFADANKDDTSEPYGSLFKNN